VVCRIFQRKTRLTKWSYDDIVCGSEDDAKILFREKRIEFEIDLAPAAAGGGGAPGGVGAAAGGADDGQLEDPHQQHDEEAQQIEEQHAAADGGGAPGGDGAVADDADHDAGRQEEQLGGDMPAGYLRPTLNKHQRSTAGWQDVRKIPVEQLERKLMRSRGALKRSQKEARGYAKKITKLNRKVQQMEDAMKKRTASTGQPDPSRQQGKVVTTGLEMVVVKRV
jgi:hypothetical protein